MADFPTIDDAGSRYLTIEETLTLPSGASTAVNGSTFQIPAGAKSFTVIFNTGATNTTADGDVDIQVSGDNSSFATLVADFIASFDAATVTATYDPVNNSAHGIAPYFRIQVTNDGNQAAETVTYQVVFDTAEAG